MSRISDNTYNNMISLLNTLNNIRRSSNLSNNSNNSNILNNSNEIVNIENIENIENENKSENRENLEDREDRSFSFATIVSSIVTTGLRSYTRQQWRWYDYVMDFIEQIDPSNNNSNNNNSIPHPHPPPQSQSQSPSYSVILNREPGDSNETCSICFEEYKNDTPIAITQCQHSYHLSCIESWLERKRDCPICRALI